MVITHTTFCNIKNMHLCVCAISLYISRLGLSEALLQNFDCVGEERVWAKYGALLR